MRLVGIIIMALIDWYVYRANRPYNKLYRKYLSYFLFGSTAILALGLYIEIETIPRKFFLIILFITLVSKLGFLPFLFIDDLRRGFIRIKQKLYPEKQVRHTPKLGEKITRSEFLVKAATVAAGIPFISLSWSVLYGAYDYQVKHQKLFIEGLPPAFDGMKIGQISDTHVGSFLKPKAVKDGIDLLLCEKPDMIFFTGDLVNARATEMFGYQAIFSKVKAPLGVYSILGNHDYGSSYYGNEYSAKKAKNLADIKATHKNMNWDLLLNENRIIKINNEEIAILGVENWGINHQEKFADIPKALKGTEAIQTKLLLSHDPSHWRARILPEHPEINAVFSGHTHGMQLGVLTDYFQWSPVQYIYKEWAGLYQNSKQQLYVNVGYGFMSFPGRLGVLPEITVFEIKKT